jgi:hypothetical protein
MLSREQQYMPMLEYIHRQAHLEAQLRSIVIDWLLEVHKLNRVHGFRHESLFLAVALVDCYISRAQGDPPCLLLVGATAMLLAAKFEEVKPLEVDDLVHYTGGTYSRQEIVAMERSMLATLSFDIFYPTAAHFLSHLQCANMPHGAANVHGSKLGECHAQDEDRESAGELSWHFLELALLDKSMLRHPPSRLAAAALVLGHRCASLPEPQWPLAGATRFAPSSEELPEIGRCAEELEALWEADRQRIRDGRPRSSALSQQLRTS